MAINKASGFVLGCYASCCVLSRLWERKGLWLSNYILTSVHIADGSIDGFCPSPFLFQGLVPGDL